MTTQEKEKQLTQMRNEAKDLQAQLGYLTLQMQNLRTEMARIRTILEYRESQFNTLSQTETKDEV